MFGIEETRLLRVSLFLSAYPWGVGQCGSGDGVLWLHAGTWGRELCPGFGVGRGDSTADSTTGVPTAVWGQAPLTLQLAYQLEYGGQAHR